MKGSAVAQSFKALASKINNQVPLGPRESDRLLTALTSSFRNHLDEVHPSPSHDDVKRPTTVSGVTRHSHSPVGHSAAHLADKHMASVLTNSLLLRSTKPTKEVNPELGTHTAAAQLKSGTDPWDLLESYHAKGCASIEVALACMQHFRRSTKGLSHDDQVAMIQEQQAGKRVLTWLWSSGLLQTQAYVDNKQMQDGLVWLVMMEGHEDFLWQLLESDLELAQPSWLKAAQKHVPSGYLWKSRILYAMAMTKLGSPHREARSADAALELYFRAVERLHWKSAGKLILTSSARNAIHKALTNGYVYRYSNTSPSLYDKFSQIYSNHELTPIYNPRKNALDTYQSGVLDLWHPTRPSATAWYNLLSQSTSESAATNYVRDYLTHPKTSSDTDYFGKTFVRASHLLKRGGRHEESNALLELAKESYPTSATKISNLFHAVSRKDLDHEVSGEKSKKPKSESEQGQRQHQELHDWLQVKQYIPTPT